MMPSRFSNRQFSETAAARNPLNSLIFKKVIPVSSRPYFLQRIFLGAPGSLPSRIFRVFPKLPPEGFDAIARQLWPLIVLDS